MNGNFVEKWRENRGKEDMLEFYQSSNISERDIEGMERLPFETG